MAKQFVILTLGMVAAISPAAAQPDTAPVVPAANVSTAPPGTPDTRYCMRVDPVTGSLIETIQCWTRDQWADQGVDVDKEWARNGVNVRAPVTA